MKRKNSTTPREDQPTPETSLQTLRDLRRMPYKAASLSPKWRAFLGAVPAEEQFSILLAGPSGTGKSTLCLQLAKEFSRLGQVLYVCAEERAKTGTIRLRARLLKISSSKIWMHDTTRYDDLIEQLRTGKYKFCFIDSIQELDVEDEQIMEIIGMFPDVVFLFVAQVDWTEKHSRGSAKWRHKVDIRLWTAVDDETECRYAHNIKNRYAPQQRRMFLFCQPGEQSEVQGGKLADQGYAAIKNRHRMKGGSIWKTTSKG